MNELDDAKLPELLTLKYHECGNDCSCRLEKV